MRATTSRATLIAALLAPQLAAQSAPPPIPMELRARFGFLGPTIEKIGDGIGKLRCGDLDADGDAEIVVEDPRRARVQVLAWEPDGAGRLTSRSEPTTGSIAGLAVADVDGDGRADFLTLDSRGRLRVELKADGAIERDPIDVGIAQEGDALHSADLDGDGNADVVVTTRDGLRAVTRLATEPVVSEPMPLDEGAIAGLHVHDLDGDGAQDLVVALRVDRMPLRIKRGRGDGTFGPWLILDTPKLRTAFPGTGTNGVPSLATIEWSHPRVVEYAMREDPDGTALELTALPSTRTRAGLPFATGDVDGDGDEDLVVGLPDRAALAVLLEDGGRFTMRTVPTFAGVGGIAIGDLDGDGKNDLVVASPDEGAIGWKRGTAPLDAFPERLPATDLPVAVTIHDGVVYAVCRTERRDATVQRVTIHADQPQQLCELGRLGGDPLRMFAAELDEHAGPELVLVVPGDGLRVVTDLGGEKARVLAAEAGFTKRMDDGALALATTGEQPSLLVAREQFVRSFRFGPDGGPVVLAQDNGPAGIESMTLVAARPDGSSLLYDRKGDRLYRLSAEGASTSVDVPPLGFTHLLALGGDAVLLGQRGVLRVPFGRGFVLEPLRTHEPPTDDTSYYGGLAVDLDGDGARELAMLDADLHGIQVLVATDDELQRALAFPIFEMNQEGANAGPNELVHGDVDGDGRQDLVAICFDRLLVYRQEQ